MSCNFFDSCIFYNSYRHNSTSKQFSLLVESYCEGQLQSICHRKKYEENICKSAPENMAPNGYLLGTHVKLKTVSTRKHERYKVKNGTCLIEDVASRNAFRADIIDVSTGGLKLRSKEEVDFFVKDQVNPVFKIVEHTIAEPSAALTKDFIKVVWSEDRVFGCAFVSPSI